MLHHKTICEETHYVFRVAYVLYGVYSNSTLNGKDKTVSKYQTQFEYIVIFIISHTKYN